MIGVISTGGSNYEVTPSFKVGGTEKSPTITINDGAYGYANSRYYYAYVTSGTTVNLSVTIKNLSAGGGTNGTGGLVYLNMIK